MNDMLMFWAFNLILFLAGLATGCQHKRDVVAGLEAKLMSMECLECEKNMLECECDDTAEDWLALGFYAEKLYEEWLESTEE